MVGAFSRRKQVVSPRSRKPTIAVIDIPEHTLHGVDTTTATTTLLVCTSIYTRDGSVSSPPPHQLYRRGRQPIHRVKKESKSYFLSGTHHTRHFNAQSKEREKKTWEIASAGIPSKMRDCPRSQILIENQCLFSNNPTQ